MTYYLHPSIDRVHLLVVCTNTKEQGLSHSGLGVNTGHTVRVLRRNHVRVDAFAASGVKPLREYLAAHRSLTHCLLEAPWVDTPSMRALCEAFPDIHFVVRVHSQVGFLQQEAGAVRLVREQLLLQEQVHNLTIAANSERLCEFLRTVYTGDCLHLPNLYHVERAHRRRRAAHDHRLLRVGAFGAIRLLKNHLSAAAAALMIAQQRDCDLEFHINVGREEHSGKGVWHAMLQLFRDVPYATLVPVPWSDWPDFRRKVAHMDLAMQPSMTETFNLVTADAAAEGIPSVVGMAIEWVPRDWQAEVDSVADIARVGSSLLSDRFAGERGLAALKRYADNAERAWLAWLGRQPFDCAA